MQIWNQIRMFLDLSDPDPLVRIMDPDRGPDPDPDLATDLDLAPDLSLFSLMC